ncbi:hypothetical protein A2886_02755 [candidate division WWE3 bacterium RIFCSPHIGHO2_01_FULL_42_13]|uniref:Mechanosensitive ion channel protein MscL n=1 Tax=candidate division WWE3 bacterium RIFCSPHIGHO2_01_FULL_42_13 TaxID=1802617 RepID=A0A1F4UU01_UNCKA|nr:MAG: hypothetical protein A2886_02755 [candidate division WWE3 bacterium RIFCSPHIGHO2_01_FULL_42_13]
MRGFIEFLKTKGVVGMAVGFVIGTQVSSVVTSLVNNVINPLLGVVLGFASNLSEASYTVGGAKVMWGSFVNTLVNFLIIAFLVYLIFKAFGLDSNSKSKKR